MANGTVWVVIPVYNAEKVLKKCVKSIQNQTYKDWKMVLVDDGSKDGSGRLCDKFAGNDDRIIVVHQANAGPGAARRKGVSQLPDDGYCAFVDSDDWLPENAFELMMKEMQKYQADVVCGRIDRTLFGLTLPNQSYQTCFSDPGYYDREKTMEKLFSACFGSFDFSVSLCAKIFNIAKIKKVILDDVKTPFSFAEDLDVTIRLMPLLNGAVVINETVYCYNMGGGTDKFMKNFLPDTLFMYSRKKEYAQYHPDSARALRMTANEIVSFSMSHLIMCERFKTYPHETLFEEAKYICGLPEIQDALLLIGEDDSGHFIGSGKAFVNKDYQALADFAYQKAQERKWKDRLLKILLR